MLWRTVILVLFCGAAAAGLSLTAAAGEADDLEAPVSYTHLTLPTSDLV